MVLPPVLLEKYRKNCGFYASTVSRIDQRILNEFIGKGHFERYLNKMRKIYREKHDFLLERLKNFEKAFWISGENAGLHVLLTSKKNIPEKELLEAAREKGIRLYGLSDMVIADGKKQARETGTVLLGYGALSLEEIREGVDCLALAWQNWL
jgi:GntR family transcriptional regulator/MocR family aminotransferase